MSAPRQPPHLTATTTSTPPTQPQQPPVELDSHPIGHPPSAHQPSSSTTAAAAAAADSSGPERRPSVYSDPELMAKLRAERSVDPAVVDDPAANEPAAEDFAVAAGLQAEGVGVGRG